MDRLKNKVKCFLKSYRMDYENISIDGCCSVFLEDMERGLEGKVSSLKMIPTYIEVENEIPLNEEVIVLDAGGTNLRVATVYFDRDRGAIIEDYKKYPMPGLDREIRKDEFFKIISDYLNGIIGKNNKIGFCFSFAIEVFPNKDGKPICFSKEIKAKEVIGQMIGENLNLAFKEDHYRDGKHIVLLNDTVATLLAGRSGYHRSGYHRSGYHRSGYRKREFDGYIGFILGTGTNCCYIEKNENIVKNKDLDYDKSQIINVESGGFDKAPRGIIDEEFDEGTVESGSYVFEKMISGAYFGALSLKVIERACNDGLFSFGFCEGLRGIGKLETKNIDDFMNYPEGGNNPLSKILKGSGEDDYIVLYLLIDSLIERAAKLTAINLSSVVIKSGSGKNPCYPVCIIAEGTTFYGLKTLKERVEYYLKGYLVEERGRYYEIVWVDNATLIGAAIAGLTN